MHDNLMMAENGILYNSAFTRGGVLEKTERSVEVSWGEQKRQLQHTLFHGKNATLQYS